jgi:NAD(P)-dependent dehydrogenase (short-subunit alcohol dehydrogenase family)
VSTERAIPLSDPPGRLAGKIALVTGAASGIGLGIVEAFVSEGARVAALDVDEAGLAALGARFGDSVMTARTDVTDEAAMEDAVALTTERWGEIDVVVANAGRGAFGAIVDHDLDEWRSIIDLCLTGVFLTIKHAGRVMRDGGSIITIASLNAIQPAEGMGAYCAAKAGATALTRVAAMELGHRGIRANVLAPGLVESAASQAFWEVPGVVDEFIENTTVGRYALPADVAAFAVFLASDESTFVSGSLHSIDGGASTKRYPDLPGAIARLIP